MLPRFHVPFPLAPGAGVELPEESAHHAFRVLRLEDGDPVVLFDGRGGEWRAHLHRAGKGARAVLESYAVEDREPPLRVTLVQALPAGDKMDFVVQKCTELGVAAIQPVAARRSVIRLSGDRLERRVQHWRQVAIAACEQCGRNQPPVVAPIVDLPQYLARMAVENGNAQARWLLAPGGGGRLREMPTPPAGVQILVGPEGGFEEDELKATALAGFQPVGLGPRVLRTETAGAAAIAAMMALWGDF
ncbi:MAG: 16S rRNA (uracil(1498)-N(3))-methyltransferase [Rhodocyclaceae bacterium]|nr:16S rRNA (uracil(1498)-N(3))-methyltransferase [Rhodocyclaceae bacterium]